MKDGRPYEQYYVVYDVGFKWDEKKQAQVRNQKWEKVAPPNTRKHAEKLLAERLSQVHGGEFIEPSKMSYREYKDLWREKYALGQVRPSTLAMYESLWNNHLMPALGDVSIAKIGTEDIQSLKSTKLSEGRAPQSVKHMLRLVRQMLEHAVDWGYIRSNPAKKVKDPTIPRMEMDFLTADECRLFLEHVPPKWYVFFYAAITTGLRQGELMAMKWSNLDWNRQQYFVRENYARKTTVSTAGFASVKTEGSAQSIDMTPTCLDILKGHRKRQAEEKLQAGEAYEDVGLIFAGQQGKPLDHRNIVNRVFEPILEAAGLRHIRFHDLRHTCASLLIDQGESPKYIQRQMRHASIKTTFDRYGHLFPEKNREAASRLDSSLIGNK
jgi:integrase